MFCQVVYKLEAELESMRITSTKLQEELKVMTGLQLKSEYDAGKINILCEFYDLATGCLPSLRGLQLFSR